MPDEFVFQLEPFHERIVPYQPPALQNDVVGQLTSINDWHPSQVSALQLVPFHDKMEPVG
jgi:hypothetical protein